MKSYRVEVKALIPFPVNKSYTLTTTGAGTAISRAIRKYRSEIGKKRLYSLTIHCELLKGCNSPVVKSKDENGMLSPEEDKTLEKQSIEPLNGIAEVKSKPSFDPDLFSSR
jgi:hypothetical protein